MLFTDGNTESGDGELLDTFKLQNTERVIRADNISLVGAIIPNVNGTQRIDQLKSIVSDPRDGIEMELTEANLNEIADDLAFRIRRLLFCRGERFSLIFFYFGHSELRSYNNILRLKRFQIYSMRSLLTG